MSIIPPVAIMAMNNDKEILSDKVKDVSGRVVVAPNTSGVGVGATEGAGVGVGVAVGTNPPPPPPPPPPQLD